MKNIIWVGGRRAVGQERKELFRKVKKVYIEIYSIQFTFKGLKEFISWTSRKTQMPNCSFLVPNIVETPMEAFPLLVIYLFNQGVLDFVLKMY